MARAEIVVSVAASRKMRGWVVLVPEVAVPRGPPVVPLLVPPLLPVLPLPPLEVLLLLPLLEVLLLATPPLLDAPAPPVVLWSFAGCIAIGETQAASGRTMIQKPRIADTH